MEENNRKGPGIFYAVVGVATLVVAIIGATFAFFSANDSADIPEGTTAAAGGVDLIVTPVTDTNTNLVPLNLQPNQTKEIGPDGKETGNYVDAKDQFEPAMAKNCKDENGNNVCQVYRIYLKNKSTTSTISVRGTLTLKSSATNMYWRLIAAEDDGADENPQMTKGEKVGYSTDVQATADGTTGNITVGGNSVDTEGVLGEGGAIASHTLAKEASVTYYVVIWLEEQGKAQEDQDADGTFSGSVFFSAVDANGNNTGITASFTQA